MINIIYIQLPNKVKAAHTKNADGSYTIFLNSALTFKSQQKAYLHELAHIQRSDLESEEEADALEASIDIH